MTRRCDHCGGAMIPSQFLGEADQCLLCGRQNDCVTWTPAETAERHERDKAELRRRYAWIALAEPPIRRGRPRKVAG